MSAVATMKRLSASIPDRLYGQLEILSEKEGRSVSNLVSYLLERAIDDRLDSNRRIDEAKKRGVQ